MFIGLLLSVAQSQAPNVDVVVEPMVSWVICYTAATERYALQPEPADTIANAVLGTCEGHEADIRMALYRQEPRPSTAEVDRRMSDLRESARRAILGDVLRTRTAQPTRR